MKFGKLLLRRAVQTEPYKSAYVNYKYLKKVIKDVQKSKKQSRTGDLDDQTKLLEFGAFFFAVAMEAQKVDGLYENEMREMTTQFTPLLAFLNKCIASHQEVPVRVLDEFTLVCKRLDQLRGMYPSFVAPACFYSGACL